MPKKPQKVKIVPKAKSVGVVINVSADEIVQYTPSQMDALAGAVDALSDAMSSVADDNTDEDE